MGEAMHIQLHHYGPPGQPGSVDLLRVVTGGRIQPHGSSEGNDDPKDPDPYLVQHRPFVLVSRLWNWQDAKWDWIGQGELQQIYEPLVVQAVPPLFTHINPQYWNIDQLT